MEMFNVKRRDILDFDNYMDLKKSGFGGPSSAKAYRDSSGKKLNKNPKLDGYQRVVTRDPAFGHSHYDSTYKAVTNDLVYKQEKKKPFTYDDTRGIPVVVVGEVKEGFALTNFSEFLNEDEGISEIESELRRYEESDLSDNTESDADDFDKYDEYDEDNLDLGWNGSAKANTQNNTSFDTLERN
jgi:hypothetical protein